MKLGRFIADGQERYGQVEGDFIRLIAGDIFGDHEPTDKVYSLDAVKLLAPVKPGIIVGLGLNYKKAAAAKGVEFPSEPILFLKPPSGVIGPMDAIQVPDAVTQPAFEVELAAVIGRRAKNVSEAEALDYVLGYTLCNDVTAKDHMVKGQPWAKGKSFDTFTPLGPWIVTDVNPDNVELAASVNGAEKQRDNTADMIFTTRQIVAFVSGIMTLNPGDVIITGTPVGGGEFNRGDTVELSSPQIGVMRNPVR
jgi:2-keto-4-pentenoate hydratase/2-oxohepta-3-ene-1,7-dioic acid hydratase in catechol pathway